MPPDSGDLCCRAVTNGLCPHVQPYLPSSSPPLSSLSFSISHHSIPCYLATSTRRLYRCFSFFFPFCFFLLSLFFLMLRCFIEFILFFLLFSSHQDLKPSLSALFSPLSYLFFFLHCTLGKEKKMDENKHAVLAFSLYFSRRQSIGTVLRGKNKSLTNEQNLNAQ